MVVEVWGVAAITKEVRAQLESTGAFLVVEVWGVAAINPTESLLLRRSRRDQPDRESSATTGIDQIIPTKSLPLRNHPDQESSATERYVTLCRPVSGRWPAGCPTERTRLTNVRDVSSGTVVAMHQLVSHARPILKGVSLMLVRRVRGRVFLLRPCKRTNQIVGYVVAVMATRWNIGVHALTVMGNHWHVCLTDLDGNIVGFQRDCHQFIARALNAHHGEFESVWASSEPTSRVECQEPDDLVGKIAYTMANPVEAGLVRYGKSWPGLRRAWPSKPLVFRKPKRFFRGKDQGGSWPEEAALELARPPGYDELSDDELGGLIDGAIDAREARFRRQHDAEGRSFLGRRGVLEQSRYDRPRTREPRFGISPRVACRNKWRRIERLRANRRWLDGYLTALARWREGDRAVVFPTGTYQMRVVHGVTCASLPG